MSIDTKSVVRLGLVSDTHMPERLAALPDGLFTALDGVDVLLHAGDVGALWVLERLSRIAPVVAVHGNDDTAEAQRAGAEIVVFGHWHMPLVYWHEGVLVINPGALAPGNFVVRQLVQTVAILEVGVGGETAVAANTLLSDQVKDQAIALLND